MPALSTNGERSTATPVRSFAVASDRKLPKAAAMLAQEIRAKILGYGLEPGTALPSEPELIEQSGLGRASVREAIRLLEAQGLVVIKRGSHGGIFVAQPDLSSLSHGIAPVLTLSKAPLRDLTTYRKMVEPPAAGLAASIASKEDKCSLLKLAEHGSMPGYNNEVAFHERVAELADNLLLRVLVMVPHDLLREHLRSESIDDSVVDEANNAHMAIAKAIVAGDSARATRAMMKHLEAFEERMGRAGRLERPIVPQEQWLRDVPEGFGSVMTGWH
ncbi:DNA-binding transcriptional regulator, FadR family [Rhodococcus jostii]|uniref:FadR family transcriptional regulator n=3 Tax=Nocardiaceae TaxID=85025 RepID=A0A2S8IP76_RHOOP|nr:FadR family transcriptional regulator [Rhodococcus opacus]RZI53913.1 MAG: FadR family transcriptional regulator [Pseudonocardia sp.]SEB38207.1 DNA-binding transcriptional regulator, FadR family [Rhodococcus jostii]